MARGVFFGSPIHCKQGKRITGTNQTIKSWKQSNSNKLPELILLEVWASKRYD